MDLEAKSSLVAIFEQVSTCRPILQSLRQVDSCIHRCNNIIDQTQKPFYTRLASQRLLKAAFLSLVWVIVVIMSILTVTLSHKVSPTLLGVALSNVSGLYWSLNNALFGLVAVENEAVAVDRIRRIAVLEPEENVDDLAKEGQQEGFASLVPEDGTTVLEARNLTLRYRYVHGAQSRARMYADVVWFFMTALTRQKFSRKSISSSRRALASASADAAARARALCWPLCCGASRTSSSAGT